jgi:hypothetical protein
MIDKTPWRLSRNAFGRLVFTAADGEAHDGITPARAFPISAPDQGVALIDRYGHELVWIDRLDDLSSEVRELVEADLARREFMPEVKRIHSVSNYATPSTWYVDTDRGKTSFVLKGEEYIRRLMPPALLITDSQGIHFLIRDRFALDHNSRRILDRFL